MKIASFLAGAALLAAAAMGSGCAKAYHDYAGCQVNCRYCPPPPLSFPQYPACVCHAAAVDPYMAGGDMAGGDTAETGAVTAPPVTVSPEDADSP